MSDSQWHLFLASVWFLVVVLGAVLDQPATVATAVVCSTVWAATRVS